MIEKPLAGVDYPARVAQLRSWFLSDEACADYLDWLRWPYGFACPRCGCVKAWKVSGRRRCAGCRRWVSVTAGTIFHGTRVPLTVWFEAAWLMCAPKNGVSALTLSKVLPIGSYQTAWTILGKYRSAIESAGKDKLCGVIEVDEWFHGGVAKGGDSMTGKHLVMAALEHAPGGRGYGRLRLGVVPNRSAFALRRFIHGNIEPGSRIITDGLSTYKATMAGYTHEARNESAPDAEPAHELLPGVHRVFSLAERWLLGTHQGGVRAGHLQEYLDEFVFRWNRRHAADRGLLFMRLLEHAVNAGPMPYAALVRTGISGDEELPTPIIKTKPGTLEITASGRPWRTSHAVAA